MLANLPIAEFLAKTAAATPIPGGGPVAALSAATAAGLVEMVANLTFGKKGFESVAEAMQAIADGARTLRESLIRDMDRDAEAYTRVLEAYRLPKANEEARELRRAAIEAAFKEAATVPLEVAEKARAVLDLAGTVITGGYPNAVTDGVVGALLARTAGLSALYNVRINLASIGDKAFGQRLLNRVEMIEADLIQKEQSILAAVERTYPPD